MNLNHPKLTNRNLNRARKLLFDVINFFDDNNIVYHLEGGTLLGIVRDKELLAWDHDVDLSICVKDAERFAKISNKLLFKGYRITTGKVHKDIYAFTKGQYRIFKVKKLFPTLIKIFFPVINRYTIVADIFVKASNDKYTYWQAMEKVMRTNSKYYSSFEYVNYRNRKLRAPYDYKNYLIEKYSDWKIPVKDWVCGYDEKTVIGDVY
ncbi:MAG: LicD family protein [Bacteroidota bacterium]|nr:LicD family protein [Bacteroidota bacterium]